MSDSEWTLQQVAAYAARYGLYFSGPQADVMLARLHELAVAGRAAASALPRPTNKANEPACMFRAPL
ncbi:hypothetical protein [Chitinasiproducens palmae]|uniref:Uncharacterized protein n=1 Tax=Chitinasiproducens palmae TaxID=1770053 RepID=A0A1H2PUC9_9BURK|nr:hypothetical protein [Chitinasiproducens palmae]SDV50787.1 hypothetical protein SAMN05216551_113106 [Chitinasiproducens palmae]